MERIERHWKAGLARHRITAERYHRMAGAGVFPPEARVELIEGEIIDMTPIGSAHAGGVTALAEWLREAVGKQAIVSVQEPVWLNADTEPLPDIALLRRREDFYSSAHPTPADVLLVVEVADASLDYDRNVKGPLYAAAGIPEFWLVDLAHRVLTIHREPSGAIHRAVHTLDTAGCVALCALPGVAVDLSRLFALGR